MPGSHKLAAPGTIPLATVLPRKATVCFLVDIPCQCLEVRKFHTVTKFLTSLEKIWPYCQKTPSGARMPFPARCMVSRYHSLIISFFLLSFFNPYHRIFFHWFFREEWNGGETNMECAPSPEPKLSFDIPPTPSYPRQNGFFLKRNLPQSLSVKPGSESRCPNFPYKSYELWTHSPWQKGVYPELEAWWSVLV